MDSGHIDTEAEKLIRRRQNSTVVFTDAWSPGVGEHKIPEEGLLPGELSAVTFRVGCYTVRSAQRLYKINGTGYSPELDEPADKDEVGQVRKDVVPENAGGLDGYAGIVSNGRMRPSWEDKLCLTHEISARYDPDPDAAFQYVCRTIQAGNSGWCEYIGDIYTVKEHGSVPDECASLLVYSHYECSTYGLDTWYKLEPAGKITKFVSDPSHLGLDETYLSGMI